MKNLFKYTSYLIILQIITYYSSMAASLEIDRVYEDSILYDYLSKGTRCKRSDPTTKSPVK